MPRQKGRPGRPLDQNHDQKAWNQRKRAGAVPRAPDVLTATSVGQKAQIVAEAERIYREHLVGAENVPGSCLYWGLACQILSAAL